MWVSQQASLQEGKNDNICHFKVQLKNVATNEYCITSTLKDGSEHYPVLLRDSNTINNIDKWEQTIFQVEYNGRLSGFNVEKGEFQNIGYNYLEEGNIYWRLDFYLDRNAADLIRVYGFSEVTTGQENKTHKAIQVAISTQTPAYGFFDSYDGLTVRNSNYGADGPCPEQLFWLIMTPDQ
jgi:hypothetical protein